LLFLRYIPVHIQRNQPGDGLGQQYRIEQQNTGHPINRLRP
jgi:hypothetical protein